MAAIYITVLGNVNRGPLKKKIIELIYFLGLELY